jgi:hypothetical protein
VEAMVGQSISRSAECEGIRLYARVKELDPEGVIGDAAIFANKLIEALSINDALAVCVDVDAVIRSRRLAVDCHAETDPFPVRRGAQDKMQIAGSQQPPP